MSRNRCNKCHSYSLEVVGVLKNRPDVETIRCKDCSWRTTRMKRGVYR